MYGLELNWTIFLEEVYGCTLNVATTDKHKYFYYNINMK